MRRRAGEVTGTERLPVSTSDDELRRLGLTPNAMLDRLQASVERDRRFVDDASHELRTLLATLRSELEPALRRPRTDEELRAALSAASRDVDRRSDTVDERYRLVVIEGDREDASGG